MKLLLIIRYALAAVLVPGTLLAQPRKAAPARPKPVVAASALLRSGPMVGYSEMREVALWVQTMAPATAQIEYWDKEKPEVKWRTAPVATKAARAHTAHLLADQVLPGRRYAYALYLNGQRVARPYPLEFQSQTQWQWQQDPPDFSFAMGSCVYVNEAPYDRSGPEYGGDYGIFTSINAQKPDFMLWMGDNTYLRPADWNTRTGIYHRYSHTRAVPEMQPLLARTHNYAIWDDHDFGPNDSDRSYVTKSTTLEAFKDFWANPNYGQGAGQGISGTFEWNDVQVFLLDDRWFRAPNRYNQKESAYLGQAQLTWLLDALTTSQATFKLIAVGGQVLNPAKVFENYSNYEQERAALLQGIAARNISGVVFLDGDRHHTELTKLERPGTYPLYDFTCSPLTSGAATGARNEANTGRVDGTLVMERNFAVVKVSGPLATRQLRISVMNKAGQQLWERTIKAAELK
ncbi:alkaline phosphatase family protein [Hymenobacter sp. BT683]|uniref:Alkaline phosphatase family protein n=1 Tax=Hymenobacter jeongseonensis TaxID=2791027 RepID=A0ABS0IKS8_9BACT|nr:alkaline phosphatase D family protein [Hymenobacter jeongseonensis]MBF9238370.1 alkaline phosphatase family protein [Hymenobacter jeongseonensis]